ncbi:MAG TPA: YIP1 family protein [Gammaproteobacteria bacterium]|nr:YIP1 family protein [Gammaproteobacteria bacterium]
MATHSRSLTACLFDVFVAPAGALEAVREHRRWFWLPLLLTVGAGALVWTWYYQTVDFAWLTDHLLSAKDMTAEQRQATGAFMTPGKSLGLAIAATIFFIFFFYALQAVYLLLAARLLGEREIGFGQWFSLTAWTRLPNLLAIIAMAIAYGMASSTQVAPSALSVLSLNGLLFHYPIGDAAFTLTNTITLTLIWSLGLLTLGVMRWLNRSASQAAAIVFLPYVVIYGTWLAFVLA